MYLAIQVRNLHYAVLHQHKSAFCPLPFVCNEHFINKQARIDDFGVLISHLK